MSATTPTINTYVSDMLALERHMLPPLQTQNDDNHVQADSRASRLLKEALATVKAHVAALDSRLTALGGHAGSPLKSGVSSALGAVASAIDKARKTEVSKDLRDDYAAMCLASASYTMLHATALGFGDQQTAQLAKQHLADYAALIMKVSATIPFVVLAELRDAGVAIDPSVAAEAEQATEQAWREGAARS